MFTDKILNEVQFIFLAGGKGTRMNMDIPKVLAEIPGANSTLIDYLLGRLVNNPNNFRYRPIIVVGYQADKVKNSLGSKYDYIYQENQLGTAHAVSLCLDLVKSRNPEHVVVAYGDMPFFSPESVLALVLEREKFNSPISMATQVFDDFLGYNKAASNYGRVIRDNNGLFQKIVEFKDATESQKLITEVSSAHYCFDANWLCENISKLDNQNAQGEYYLTALPAMALLQNKSVVTVQTNSIEALGANTQEDLAMLGQILNDFENNHD